MKIYKYKKKIYIYGNIYENGSMKWKYLMSTKWTTSLFPIT